MSSSNINEGYSTFVMIFINKKNACDALVAMNIYQNFFNLLITFQDLKSGAMVFLLLLAT